MNTIYAPSREGWKIPPRFSREKIESLLWIADEFVKFVSQLDDVKPLTFSDFLPRYGFQRQWLSRDEIRQLASGLADRPAYQHLGAETFSPAELFALFAFALTDPGIDNVPVRHVIGPTDEPVETPLDCQVSREDFLDACRDVEMFVRDMNRVPYIIEVESFDVGPGGFLLAMARAILQDSELIQIPPADNLPEPLHEDDYKKLDKGTPAGYIQKRGTFGFPNIRHKSQLQYWTVKPAAVDAG